MSFPTVNGMLNDTDEETSRSPIAVNRGRRSGRARATILRNEVDVGTDPSAFGEKEDGRKRERMERRVGGECEGVGLEDVGARVVGLVTKKRPPCAKAYVGHGGYRLLVEGCGKVRRVESARRVPEEYVEAITTRRRCKPSIMCDAVNPNAIDNSKPVRKQEKEMRERNNDAHASEANASMEKRDVSGVTPHSPLRQTRVWTDTFLCLIEPSTKSYQPLYLPGSDKHPFQTFRRFSLQLSLLQTILTKSTAPEQRVPEH